MFVRTKRGADRLVKRLGPSSVDAVAMHGDKSQGQRERALARFERGNVDTLVATDVAARGLDVDGVTHVIHFDAPEDREAYVHRVGPHRPRGPHRHRRHLRDADQAKDVGKIAADARAARASSPARASRSRRPTRGAGTRPHASGGAASQPVQRSTSTASTGPRGGCGPYCA